MLNLSTLAFDLPEDVLKRKWAGDFEGEIALIDVLLQKDIPPVLKERLLAERSISQLYPKQFNICRDRALQMIRELIPDFSSKDLDALELDRSVEYIYVHGEKHYLHSFLDTLLHVNAAFAERAGRAHTYGPDETMQRIKADGEMAVRIHIRGELKLSDDVFDPKETYRVHLPIPQFCAQQSDIEILSRSDAFVAPENEPQRTLFYERRMAENMPFVVEYRYVNRIKYVDPFNDKPSAHIYPNAPQPTEDDLAELYPHIVFTPYLTMLANDLKGNETDPIVIAWRFYDYITTHIHYSYMRGYFLIDRQAEYCALNGKGDCGIQALLFITLCRIVGIPARWQSGLSGADGVPGSHDWAQFYAEPFGWLFADPSYGGSSFRMGYEERRKFYFGNIDPYRMIANSRYQTDFTPAKQFDRDDPYDNQSGEVETEHQGLIDPAFDTVYKTLELTRL